MSTIKTSFRFFDTVPVRSVWDEETAKWWLCAMDVISAVVDTANPRVYWATVKRRHGELFANCGQLKPKAHRLFLLLPGRGIKKRKNRQ